MNRLSHVFIRTRGSALMEVTIKHLDHVKFAIQTRSHTILCDQPAENGGDDAGMTPPELMLASLGSCALLCRAVSEGPQSRGDRRGGFCHRRQVDASSPARQLQDQCHMPALPNRRPERGHHPDVVAEIEEAWEVQTSGPAQSVAFTATITSISHAISASFLPQSRSPQRPSKKIVRRIWL